MTQTKAVKKAVAKYDKTNTQGLFIKLHKTRDRDIIDKLESVESKQGYIKQLIRENIKGKWIERNNPNMGMCAQERIECSVCGKQICSKLLPYRSFCPCCGADMREDNNV